MNHDSWHVFRDRLSAKIFRRRSQAGLLAKAHEILRDVLCSKFYREPTDPDLLRAQMLTAIQIRRRLLAGRRGHAG